MIKINYREGLKPSLLISVGELLERYQKYDFMILMLYTDSANQIQFYIHRNDIEFERIEKDKKMILTVDIVKLSKNYYRKLLKVNRGKIVMNNLNLI